MQELDSSPNADDELLTPASLWQTFHWHQKEGFDALYNLKRVDTSAWGLRQYREHARCAWAELPPQKMTLAMYHIQKAIDGRVKYYERFSYPTATSRATHRYYIEFLRHLLAIGKTVRSERESDSAGHDDQTHAAQSVSTPCDDVPTTLDEIACFSFLEAVKATSTRICGLWASISDSRHELSSVAASKLNRFLRPFSVVSDCFLGAIQEHLDLEQVLHQCHLLNPEWIPFALHQCSKKQFWPDFKVGHQAFINVWRGKLDDSDAIRLKG